MPHRDFTYDTDNVPSLDLVVQAQGRPARNFSGTVDSGATGSVLSLEDAATLGLGPGDLRETGKVAVADGSQVSCLTANLTIAAQVLLTRGDIPFGLWGPSFYINPVFIDGASPLWGQADFFATFGVNFERPQFTLKY